MKCLYINLESEAGRRDALRRSFTMHRAPRWELGRVQAIDANYIRRNNVRGSIRDTEKACFLSHKQAIAYIAEIQESALIVEDDTLFGSRSCQLIDACVEYANRSLEWDLLYTDVGIAEIGAMVNLASGWQALMKKNEVAFLDLKGMQYYAASAYVVNTKSAPRLNSLIDGSVIDIPIDLLLRRLTQGGYIKAFTTFPFLTTVSDHANCSTVQLSHTARTDLIWTTLRRMMWIEGQAFDPAAHIEAIAQGVSQRSKDLGLLWAALADPSFAPK